MANDSAYDRARQCLQHGANEAGTGWALLAIADAINEVGDIGYIRGIKLGDHAQKLAFGIPEPVAEGP